MQLHTASYRCRQQIRSASLIRSEAASGWKPAHAADKPDFEAYCQSLVEPGASGSATHGWERKRYEERQVRFALFLAIFSAFSCRPDCLQPQQLGETVVKSWHHPGPAAMRGCKLFLMLGAGGRLAAADRVRLGVRTMQPAAATACPPAVLQDESSRAFSPSRIR